MYEVDQNVKEKSKNKYHSDAHLKNYGIIIKIYSSYQKLLKHVIN